MAFLSQSAAGVGGGGWSWLRPHSNDLAASLRAGGDKDAHTFNNESFGTPGVSGRPKWTEGVEEAIGNENTKISVALDGIPGGSAVEKFAAAYRRGVPLQGDWRAAALSGNGTAWELAKLGNAVRFGRREWGGIDFYHGRKIDLAEPDWSELRRGF
ncbi:polymorphic toxin type 27 domain-containing protein [Paractinoplanes ferrugineus]|uniref:polymorphic toxin type 27 domain-containing protein n=1 Tax=Paractinoplanes ferrugineus TaxID=113564 RepID=UPI00194293E3